MEIFNQLKSPATRASILEYNNHDHYRKFSIIDIVFWFMLRNKVNIHENQVMKQILISAVRVRLKAYSLTKINLLVNSRVCKMEIHINLIIKHFN
ncbi:hypothetical protein BpHYR1_011449 [Brachionus plicatilis]|uniref:Uncharacterized protein n=1 Tax=Brachionus plicatilis TaxID=10195 RepID=A0A3M7QEQ5_BRAPC|nr:hypothetical protein BpHYR1_011449 [Brachionus plicatilis]